ncbi:hypothetical protein B0H19DRAFT_1066491 [Mycena capillaripes]|nr:hypothetical protein B0H19DRAFT_1066491 [Mycena capillaripes]
MGGMSMILKTQSGAGGVVLSTSFGPRIGIVQCCFQPIYLRNLGDIISELEAEQRIEKTLWRFGAQETPGTAIVNSALGEARFASSRFFSLFRSFLSTNSSCPRNSGKHVRIASRCGTGKIYGVVGDVIIHGTSKECQKAHWKTHKAHCAMSVQANNITKALGPEGCVRLKALRKWSEDFGSVLRTAAASAIDIRHHRERIANSMLVLYVDFHDPHVVAPHTHDVNAEVLSIDETIRRHQIPPLLLDQYSYTEPRKNARFADRRTADETRHAPVEPLWFEYLQRHVTCRGHPVRPREPVKIDIFRAKTGLFLQVVKVEVPVADWRRLIRVWFMAHGYFLYEGHNNSARQICGIISKGEEGHVHEQKKRRRAKEFGRSSATPAVLRQR